MHCKFNCITVALNRTQHGFYIIQNVHSNFIKQDTFQFICVETIRVFSFINRVDTRAYLALHFGGTPSQETGTSRPSCQLLDNRLYMSPISNMKTYLGKKDNNQFV